MKSVAELIKSKPSTAVFLPPIRTKQRIAKRITLGQLDETIHPLVKTACNAARKWASLKKAGNDGVSLIIVAIQSDIGGRCTGYGCGKTHIAKSILWSIYYSLQDDDTPIAPYGRFFEAKDIINQLGATSSPNNKSAASSHNNITKLIPSTCPIVVIDDVGTEGVLKFVAKEYQETELHSRYFTIINYCYAREISVVITANMSINNLREHVGGRAWSRLEEMASKDLIVDMTGVPDQRPSRGGR